MISVAGAAFDGVIFDLDGTLIDSAASLHGACTAMMADLSLPVPDLATVTGMVGNGVPTLVARCLHWASAGGDLQSQAERLFRGHYDADPVSGVTVFDGATQLLDRMARSGTRIGLCTNKPEGPTHTLLEALSLGPFQVVVGGDTLAQRKPDPAPLLLCCRQMGVASDRALYVGDSAVDAQTAGAAGVAYVHLQSGYQNGTLAVTPRLTVADLPALIDALDG